MTQYQHVRNRDIQKAITISQQALQLALDLNYQAGINKAQMALGTSYLDLGDFAESLSHYLEALKLARNLDKREEVAKCLNNIAILYSRQDQYNKAISYYKRAIAVFDSLGHKTQRASALSNLGVVYFFQNDYSSALKYYQQAQEIHRQDMKDSLGYYIATANIGETQMKIGQYEQGLDNTRRSAQYFRRQKNDINLSVTLHTLANILYLQHHYDAALRWLRQSLQLSKKTGYREYQEKSYKLLADIFAATGQWQKAFNTQKDLMKVHDELVNRERDRRISVLENRFEIAKKNKAIQLLNKQSELQQSRLQQQQQWRNTLLLGLLLLVITAFVLYRINKHRKGLNAKLRRQNKLIEDKNKQLTSLMDEKNEFMGMAAHDLKTPLSAITSLADLLDDPDIDPGEQHEYSDMIRRSSRRMLELVNNLLNVNAIESGQMALHLQPLDIAPLAEASIDNFQVLAKAKDISLEMDADFEQHLPKVQADPAAVVNIFDNLISNAIKYSPRGSTITIGLSNSHQRVRLEVSDNGPGISTEEQHKLFSRFSRISTQPTNGESSTGLGLYIVKKQVDAMNGHVKCMSRTGEGSTFQVDLPLAGPG